MVDEKPNGRWALQKEKILMAAGLAIIFIELGFTAVGVEFHFEFLLAGLSLCGIAIAQWGDKKA